MKARDVIPNILLILIGAFFCISSVTLGLGSVNAPGPGLGPFGMGGILILLSLLALLESYLKVKDKRPPQLIEWKSWGLLLWILFSIFIYAFVLDLLGFMLTSFILLTFLFKVSGVKSWKGAIGASLISTVVSFLLFDYLLQCNLPKGFFEF
jgi:putative tricarboxylic transport membrane protein